MTSVGGIIEQKPIGLQFGVEGTYDGTELVNGKVQLKQVNTDANGNPVYATQGTWISKVIDIGDEFADYGKVFTAHTNSGNSSIKVETRTSNDGVTFDDYATVGSDGTILSTKRKYIQMKVTFYSGFSDANMIISSFNSPTEASKFNNEFIDTSNGLTLKRNYEFDMTKDNTWSGDGSLHKKKLLDNDWLKIDKLNVPTTGTALNKTLILSKGDYKKYDTINGWQTVSSTTPTVAQFTENGIDDVDTLSRKVQKLPPQPMLNKSDILSENDNGKVFSKTLDLKKYIDIKSMKVEVR